MATARELLEQADALMRKNRSRNDAEIPVLTDRVEDPSPVAAEDDVPLLLDAVETAADEEVSIVPGSERGEPSLWPGPDTIDPSTHSITGPTPDTLAVVPPVTLKAVGSQATPPPRGSEPAPAASSPLLLARAKSPSADNESVFAPSATAAQPTPETVEVSSPPVEGNAPRDRIDAKGDADEVQIEIIPLPEEDEEEPVSASLAVAEEDEAFSQTIAAADEDVSEEWPTPGLTEGLPAGFTATEDHEPPIERRMRTDDDERWQALAEQISMQVLQRIDLFTDTGLKVQLAEHLRPIVERAGSELVAAINDHVGRLLRTYVSEAIEREIAQWRNENR